ncbi:MAG: ATP-binding protein [Bacilli bacterium]
MEIKRDYYLKKLIDKENNKLIKIITGIRRCGKSYLLNTIFKNYLLDNGIDDTHIISVALDDIDNYNLLNPLELSKYLKSKIEDDDMYYIILDEIQLVENFVRLLNGLLRIDNVDVYVTGSNSKFLSSDIVTEFRGRGDEIKVYPLSFAECYSVLKKDKSTIWKEYLTYGGLPLVILQPSIEDKVAYLNNGQKNVYINDVIERNNIQNDKELNMLVEMISSSVGSLTNPLKLSNSFTSKGIKGFITDKTIYSYLRYLEDAFLIEKAVRYDVRGKKYIDTPYKYYFTDMGIRNASIGFRQIEENHLMENVIYIELKKRGYNVDIGVVEIREADNRKKLEIDFVVNKGYDKYYIQSALNIDDEKLNQELRPLLNVDDFFKKIIIVGKDVPKYKNENGILVIGIYDFLLTDNSLDY